jgi:hypothetical protein
VHAAIPLLALGLVPAGCQYDPHAHLYTRTEPLPANVVGRYVLSQIDGFERKELGPNAPVVELRADGTFVASCVASSNAGLRSIRDIRRELTSDSGTWSLDTLGWVDNGDESKAVPVWGIQMRSATPPYDKVDSPTLGGEKPPYDLIFVLGDPDGGEALILHRAVPEARPRPR